MDGHGVGPTVAARIWLMSETSPASPIAPGSRPGPAPRPPLDASFGEQNCHRLSRAGNRRINRVIHIAAIKQIRLDTNGRDYYRRKRAEGKKTLEAIRCVKHRISDAVHHQHLDDAREAVTRPRERHRGATQESNAVDLPSPVDTSDQLPGPRNRRYAGPVGRKRPATQVTWP